MSRFAVVVDVDDADGGVDGVLDDGADVGVGGAVGVVASGAVACCVSIGARCAPDDCCT